MSWKNLSRSCLRVWIRGVLTLFEIRLLAYSFFMLLIISFCEIFLYHPKYKRQMLKVCGVDFKLGGLNRSQFDQCQRSVKPLGVVSQALPREIFYFLKLRDSISWILRDILTKIMKIISRVK